MHNCCLLFLLPTAVATEVPTPMLIASWVYNVAFVVSSNVSLATTPVALDPAFTIN